MVTTGTTRSVSYGAGIVATSRLPASSPFSVALACCTLAGGPSCGSAAAGASQVAEIPAATARVKPDAAAMRSRGTRRFYARNSAGWQVAHQYAVRFASPSPRELSGVPHCGQARPALR